MRASPIQSSFNSGELSPRLEGRVDIGKYASGAKRMEGYIPLIQGPAMRRGGTRFVAEVKDSTKRTWLVRFEFNTQQAYELEFGDQYIRFFANHGQVIVSGVAAYNGATAYAIGDLALQGGINYYCIAATTGNAPPNASFWYPLTGSIYEIPSPWTAADLTDANGLFQLRIIGSADVLYITHPLYQQRKLQRVGATNWQISALITTNGPFKTQNITATTVYASAATGVVTLTASASIFLAGHVGALFYLEQKSLLGITQWEPGKAIGLNALRRSDGKNYKALNAATTGGNKPIHTSGAVYDGDTGVQWQYQDPGYGYGIITAVGGTTATMTVVKQLPDNAVLIANASTRWAFGAWSTVEGWPSHVTFYKERLTFGRSQSLWQSVAGDYENFANRDDGGVVTTDSAISITLQSPKVNSIQWMEPTDSLLVGTAGSEFAVQPLTLNQPYGPDNVTAPPVAAIGSKSIQAVRIGEVVVFVQRSGTKLRDIIYDNLYNRFQSVDQSVLAEHIPAKGIGQIAYQQEPYSLLWAWVGDGTLVAMTYSREQYPEAPHGGWHRHPLGGAFGTGNAVVESISIIPAPAGDRDELWMIVKRTINGATKRYIEFMEWERRRGDDPQDSFYVDCGLTLNNTQAATLTPGTGATVSHTAGVVFTAGSAIWSAGDVGREIHYRYSALNADGITTDWFTGKAVITAYTDTQHVVCTINSAFPSLALIASAGWRMTVTTISGLSHLEGQTVDVLVDGATHPQRVVTAGAITLQQGASKVQVGLPWSAKLQTMRTNAGGADGTSQGKKTRINKAAVRLIESAGLKFGTDFVTMDDIDFRDPSNPMDNAPPLFTGDKELDVPGDWNTDPWMCFQTTAPLPSVIAAVMPQVTAQDKG